MITGWSIKLPSAPDVYKAEFRIRSSENLEDKLYSQESTNSVHLVNTKRDSDDEKEDCHLTILHPCSEVAANGFESLDKDLNVSTHSSYLFKFLEQTCAQMAKFIVFLTYSYDSIDEKINWTMFWVTVFHDWSLICLLMKYFVWLYYMIPSIRWGY